MATTDSAVGSWPRLVFAELKDTVYAVHMWTQVVGKIRLALTPLMTSIRPDSAQWVAARGEFLLPYEAVRTAADPAAALMSFLESTYDVSADLAKWDRTLLEERPRCNCVILP
jgi:hypothetical protein